MFLFMSCDGVDPEMVTVPSDKEFKWMKWKDSPTIIKKAAKLVPYYDQNLYDYFMELEDENAPYGGCEVNITLLDLNENGIYGFGFAAIGRDCCSPSSPECAVWFTDDGGVLETLLGYDQYQGVTPWKNAVLASTSRKFIFQENAKIDQDNKEKLLKYFKYN